MHPTTTQPGTVRGLDPDLLVSVDVVAHPFEGGYTVRAFLDCHAATPAVEIHAATDEDVTRTVGWLTDLLGEDALVLRPGDRVVRRSIIASVAANYDKPAGRRGSLRTHELTVYLNLRASTPRIYTGYAERSELDAVLGAYHRGAVNLFAS